ncbi:iron(III) transport system permease protein [Desulfatibacillum alkenivorans DSM 16219]|uniref:Iron(III) transport system permease protein n=2 Tax=Desulfatibacillum alkenivorans TaxID=259354 RepID=A0A1M6XUA4_9BACT|nr:iron(III) transport system permease protein [Desulfatibacillum alkenivorans DSM 16219]
MGRKRLLAFSLLFSGFVLAPFLMLFFSALTNGEGSLSFENLHVLKLTSRQWVLLGRSVLLGVGASLGCVILGAPMSLLLNRTDVWGRSFFRKVYWLSLILPPYIQAIVWSKYIPGGIDSGWTGMTGLPAAFFVFILSFYPIVTLLVSSGLEAMDQSLEETARLHRGPWAAMRKVTLPLLFPHIACGAILVFVFTIINFEVADILRLKVYPLEIFIFFSAYYDEKSATILSLPLIFTTLIFVWAQMRYMGEKSYVNLGRSQGGGIVYSLGRRRYVLALFPAVITFLALAAPILALLKGAGNLVNYGNAWKGGAGAVWYSLWTSAASAGGMALFSFPVAYCLVRMRGGLRGVLDFLIQTPFGAPSIVLGIGFITLWNQPFFDAVYGTSLLLILAMIAAYSPFVIKVISAGIKRVDEDLESVGRMGAGPLKVAARILLPLTAPSLIAGFAVGFILSLSNLGTSLLVVAPGRSTLPITIYNYLHYGADETVCALSLFLLALTAASLALLLLIYKYLSGRAWR